MLQRPFNYLATGLLIMHGASLLDGCMLWDLYHKCDVYGAELEKQDWGPSVRSLVCSYFAYVTT